MNFWGYGCREVEIPSFALEWPDVDFNGFIQNTKVIGETMWELITEKI